MSLQSQKEHIGMIKAERRMVYYMLIFLFLLLFLAGNTFPFIDHDAKFENIIYGLCVTAPFMIINLISICLTGKDTKE